MPAIGDRVYQPVGVEDGQRFADGRLGDAEPGREVVLDEALAGRQVQPDDHLAEGFVDGLLVGPQPELDRLAVLSGAGRACRLGRRATRREARSLSPVHCVGTPI